MALPHLTDEQIRDWTREQKDRWWLANVFRGNMAQLTLRSAITGFILGGLLSATNLYVGAKTGWTLGVGLTSVILAFSAFRVLSRIGLAKDFTILENNAMQSIATSAGYMTGPLISGIAAYMMVTNKIISPWHMLWFNLVLSVLGVLVAFPMKRRFINDEQAPFPEGRACGVLLDTLYTSGAAAGLFKARALAITAAFAGLIKFASGEAYQQLIQHKWFKIDEKNVFVLPEKPLTALFSKIYFWGIPAPRLDINPTLDLAMFGAGGLMNIRYGLNMFFGMVAMWVFTVPHIINHGDASRIDTKTAQTVVISAADAFRRTDVLNSWALWPGVIMLVVASILAFLAKPKVIISAFAGLFKGKSDATADPLKDIEFPLWISFVGIPIVGAAGVWMAHEWFGVQWLLGALAIPLIIALTLIAVNATALTSITPVGSLSKITQFTFGVMDPKNPATNLMTACMTTEVASNAANLLMDIKPGYMLGAKPRQQAVGHIIGIISGALASTPLFFILFLAGHPDNPFVKPNPDLAAKPVDQFLITEQFSFTAAVQWRGISDLINHGIGSLPASAQWAMLIAAIFGAVFELVRVLTNGKSPISPVAIGLGIVLPPDSTLWMFLGSLFFWYTHKLYTDRPTTLGNKLWIQTHEPICAGLIAGTALVGIGDQLVKVFCL